MAAPLSPGNSVIYIYFHSLIWKISKFQILRVFKSLIKNFLHNLNFIKLF